MSQSFLHKLSSKDALDDSSLLRTLIDSLPEQVYVKDTESRYVLNNLAHVRALGAASPEEIAGKSDFDFYPKELIEPYRADEREVIRSGRPLIDKEEPSVDGEGNERWHSTTKVPLRDGDGEIVGLVGTTRDVTDQKEAEEARKESEARFRQLFERSTDALLVHDGHGRMVDCNAEACRSLGYTREELLKLSVKDFVTDVLSEEEKRARKGDTPWEHAMAAEPGIMVDYHENEHQRKDGTTFPVEVGIGTIDYGGQRLIFASARDITERKRAEEKIRESEERFRSLARNATDLITVLEEDGTICYESPTIERILGYPPEERIGKNAFDYLHPDDKDRSKATFAKALENPGQVQRPVEFRLRHKDGSWRHMETTRTNLVNDPGVKGVVANSRDITERRRAEEALKESEERYRTVVEQSVEAIWLFDPDTKQVLESNTAFQEMLGYTAEELKEMTNYDFVTHSRQNIDSAIQRIVQERKGFFGERKYRRKDGAVLDVEVSGSVIPYQGKEVVCAVARDLTKRKEAEEALRESEERFRSAFEDSPIGVALVDLDGRRFRLNRALCEMLGYSEEELLCTYLEHVHPDDREISSEHLRRLLEEGTGNYTLERRYLHADGHVVWNLTSVSLIQGSRGEPSHLVCLHQDITERKELEERLRHQAFYDSLTDLPTRILFLDRLGHALDRAGREGGSLAVLLADLDDFKIVNDSLGHDAGNAVLVEVAKRLRHAVRPGDTVGRIFGDEFAILLEAPAGMEEANLVAQRIEERLREPFEAEGQEVYVSPSIGISLAETAEDESKEVLRHADLAMYEAKSRGKAQHEAYDPGMDIRAAERMNLERDLHRAIEREEFEIHYQPKVLLETGAIAGVEALLRWQHPERGLLEASQFIQLAEKSGLINQIGPWLLKESCRQLKEWQERFSAKLGLPFGMCVNLSAEQIRQPDLADNVAGVLRETGLDPGCLMLEISERTAKEDAEETIGRLRELKDLGVELALDDFGTGYCSLVYLEHSLLDFLKIDRLLVHRKREDNPEGYGKVVSAMTSMAHSLDLAVIVEGVETEEQLAKLKELGCEMAQGNYFAKPLPSEDIEPLLREGISS